MSAPFGCGESILFIYRVLFAVRCNDLIFIPRRKTRRPQGTLADQAEALAALLIPYYQFLWDFPRVTGPSAMVNACAFARWTRRISRSPNGSFSTYWSPYHFSATSVRDLSDLGAERMKIVLIKHDPCRNPVFYLLSALGSDQQVPVLFSVAPVWQALATHFISFAQHDFARWDTVHGFTSVLYPSETLRTYRV